MKAKLHKNNMTYSNDISIKEEENKIAHMVRHKVVKRLQVNKNFSVTLYENFEKSKKTPIVVGFADIGITPLMVTGFLLEQLHLPLIGVIKANNMPPSSVVSKTQASYPMRIYGNERVTIFTSENKISAEKTPKLATQLVHVILAIAKEMKSEMIWCTEGVPTEKLEIDRDIQFVTTSEEVAERMKALGHSPLKSALISGISGGLAAECSEYEAGDEDDLAYLPEISIMLSPTASHYPDALTSVTLLKTLQLFLFSHSASDDGCEGDRFCDTSKLERNAKEIECKVKELISPSSSIGRDDPAFSMFM